MTRDDIQKHYMRLSEKIASDFAGFHVPADIQHYYLLSELISLGKFEQFIARYGLQPIDADFAEIGKSDLLALGPLNSFEKEVCALWHKRVEEFEKLARRTQLSVVGR